MDNIDRKIEGILASIEKQGAIQAKTDMMLDKVGKRLDDVGKRLDEVGKRIEAVNENVNGISKSNGNVAEEYFENVLAACMSFAGMHFDEIIKRKRYIDRKREDEFDIIMLNGENTLIIETKYKAREKYIDQVIKKAESFRYWFPERKENKVFLGLASFRFEENIIDKARKKGIAVIQQLGGKTVVNCDHLKVY